MELANLVLKILGEKTGHTDWTFMFGSDGSAKIVGVVSKPAARTEMAGLRAAALQALRDTRAPLANEDDLVVVGKDDPLGKEAWKAMHAV
jgi:hypothetical protein